MGRYSMAGLQMYGDDLGAFMSGEDIKTSLMAAGAGAAGILVTSYVLSKLPGDMLADPANNSRLKSLIGLGIGVLGGRMIDQWGASRDTAMGFVGAVAGASLASLAASWMPETFPSVALAGGGLADADLAALEATVATNSAAWRAPALGAPVVSDQVLRGTETTSEEIAAYTHLMDRQAAPPPSF